MDLLLSFHGENLLVKQEERGESSYKSPMNTRVTWMKNWYETFWGECWTTVIPVSSTLKTRWARWLILFSSGFRISKKRLRFSFVKAWTRATLIFCGFRKLSSGCLVKNALNHFLPAAFPIAENECLRLFLIANWNAIRRISLLRSPKNRSSMSLQYFTSSSSRYSGKIGFRPKRTPTIRAVSSIGILYIREEARYSSTSVK